MAPSVSISEMASAELKEDVLELCLVVTLGFLVLIIALCNLFVRRDKDDKKELEDQMIPEDPVKVLQDMGLLWKGEKVSVPLWFPYIARMDHSRDGGYSWEFLVGVCRPVLQILTLFQTKKSNFPDPFSDLAFRQKFCYHYLE